MRSFTEIVIPLAVVALGYLGVQKIATRAHWSLFAKMVVHSVAASLLLAILLYEYFSERPIIDRVREALGEAVCNFYVLANCPPVIQMQVAEEEVQRYWRMAFELKKQGKVGEAAEMERKARELADRASELREKAEEHRALVAVAAAVRERSVIGVRLGRGAVAGGYALQSWSDAVQGGEAILKLNPETSTTLADFAGNGG